MIKKRLEWLKRGLCITLAGAMIICSDTMAFAADAANGECCGTDRRDRSFDGMKSQIRQKKMRKMKRLLK